MSEYLLSLMMLTTHRPTKESSFSDRTQPMLDLIWQYGYPAEVHSIVTEDSYINAIFRIRGSCRSPPAPMKPVVYLQHAMFLSSTEFVIAGRERAPALMLADAGYDVWLGNARGNRYSRDHKYLTVSDKEYWNFSWHEIGVYDLPAAIDYILTETNQTKLHYIGFSEGTTVFFVMASERPEYNEKIRTMQALSPVVFLKTISSSFWFIMLKYITRIRPNLTKSGIYELLPYSRSLSATFVNLVRHGAFFLNPSAKLFFSIGGGNSGQYERRELSTFLEYLPAGASTGRVVHYGQLAGTANFRHFDFGIMKNIAVYRRLMPPDYRLENVKAPLFLHYGTNDGLNHEANVLALNEKLRSSVVELRRVPLASWKHIDFVYGKDLKSLLFDHIIEQMARYN